MTERKGRSSLDSVLAALSDVTRRELFEAIVAQPGMTTSELAATRTPMTRWGVIKHLAVLREAGLLQTLAAGRLRRHYPETAALAELRAWLERV